MSRIKSFIKSLLFFLSNGKLFSSTPRGTGYKKFQTNKTQNDFVFLVDKGLLPSHRFLDIGCGGGRLGVPLIDYLDKSIYHAFDKETFMIKTFKKFIYAQNLNDKMPNIKIEEINSFEYKVKFDFIYAYSVFTHITYDEVNECLKKISKIISKNGFFFASFHLGSSYLEGETHFQRPNEFNNVWYGFKDLEKIASQNGLKASFVGNKKKNWEGVERDLFDVSISVHGDKAHWSPWVTPACLENKCAASPHTHGDHQEMMMFRLN